MKQIKASPWKYMPIKTAIFFAVCFVFLSSFLPQNASAQKASPKELTVLALGDSLTAGYNLPTHAAFPNKLEKTLREKGHPVHIVNAGVSGDTARGGLNRLSWSLTEKTDMVILALGANDALRGLDPKETKKSLGEILKRLSSRAIPVLLVGMYAPPNMGPVYTQKFKAIYPALAKEYNVPLYPFFLEGVASIPKLNQADGIHPTEEGIDIIVKNILPHIEKLIVEISEKN